jgi:hypothetical protein
MAGFFMRGRMGGMRLLAINWCLLASDGNHPDSRFGHGPTPYTRDPNANFLWVIFIMLMVIALAWYILSVMNKRPPE